MQITNLLVLGAALGAVAAPSGHSHLHRSAHEKRANIFYKAGHSKVGVPAKTSAPAPPAPTPTPSSAASAAPAAPSSAAPASVPQFCNGVSKRATAADIASVGNIGRPGQYACNIMQIDNSLANSFKYTTVFTNVDTVPYVMACGLKIGQDGVSINGFFETPHTYTVQAGQSLTIAYEEDTQSWCAFNPGPTPDMTSFGQHGGTWIETDTGSERNNGWSGADVSILVATSQNMRTPGAKLCSVSDPSTCSITYADGTGVNAFVKGTDAMDGLGINQPSGDFHLTVQMGYTGGK